MASSNRKIALGPAGEQIKASIRRAREQVGLTYVELSKRLEEIGRPIPVLGLRRIEAGERRVDVDDLEALAYVLGVPPIQPIYPGGVHEQREVPPGISVSTMAALRWFTGEDGPAMTEEQINLCGRGDYDESTGLWEWYEGVHDWKDKAAPVRLLRQHMAQVKEWSEAPTTVHRYSTRSEVENDELLRVRLTALRARIEKDLRATRDQMRRRRLLLPQLPEKLVGLDEAAASEEARQIADRL